MDHFFWRRLVKSRALTNNVFFMSCFSIVVSILACHVGDLGSILGNSYFNLILVVLTVDSGEPVMPVVWVLSLTKVVWRKSKLDCFS